MHGAGDDTRRLATGFQLNENSASSLGNAFAAGAAFTDDVSAMWWNPAALSQFPRMQGAAALHVITPSIKFSNNASLPATNQPLGGNGGDAGGYNFVPNMYLSVPINQQWTRRPRGQRPVRPDDGVRRRLDRPLPGAQIGDPDDQRQSGDLVEGDPAVRDRRLASTTST